MPAEIDEEDNEAEYNFKGSDEEDEGSDSFRQTVFNPNNNN